MLQARPAPTTPADGESAIDWEAVWRHALRDAEVVVLARIALDDSNAAVITAAAELVTCLLGAEDGAADEAVDAHPFTGKP